MAQVLWVSVELPDRDGQGGQRRQFHQIRELVERGHDITVVVPASRQNGKSIRQLAKTLRPRLHLQGRAIPFQRGRVHRLVSDPRWHAVVMSHHDSASLLPASVGKPVLLDFHNVMSYWHRSRGDIAMAARELSRESAAISRATAVTTCSEAETVRLIEMHPRTQVEVFTSPLGIDPAEWPDQPFSRRQPRISLFGSWDWMPNALGLAWFLDEVHPRLVMHDPSVEVVIAGSGMPLEGKLPAGVEFVGRVADLAEFTAQACVVAVPVIDGVGAAMKYAEALASGAAVIATPDGANAFGDTGAFISSDPETWSEWIAARVANRLSEPVPAVTRRFALSELTWSRAVEPIDRWISR